MFRANLANSNLCYLCLETKQELQHMLVSCQFIAEFWEVFLDPWYKSHVSIELELSTIKIFYSIIGNNHLNKLTKHLLLLAKNYIYCCSHRTASVIKCLSNYSGKQSYCRKTNSNKSINSPEYYYNKWKPLIEKKFVC